ncbi:MULTISPECIES: antibiotic biosynthesis monooxygenase [Oerskovia]|jgi:heme-degrading monooxygenase HmoA|uniref:Antibiotic biosynthesis monooxygenase n=1 Tax=Oerskovia merdavium TaxID=2762227 RepID=A0ABR8TY58_9CELL|nr:antibiotic biosynthesis monooxygenase [Oerskovia merdavium]MBD7980702.1 antibiotic biosynthesis monooxygenase [Oerskovia merdavium]
MFTQVVVHRPKDEFRGETVAFLQRVTEAARVLPGVVEAVVWAEGDGERFVLTTTWESPATFAAGEDALFDLLQSVPYDEWMREPLDVLLLDEIPPPAA